MGATTFHTGPWKGEVDAAYSDAVSEAYYMSGHGGYTGTIAEKSGYFVTDLPAGVQPHIFFDYLSSIGYDQSYSIGERPTAASIPDWAAKYGQGDSWLEKATKDWDDYQKIVTTANKAQLERAAAVYDDKWGPAVAVNTPDGWHFGGYASC